MKSFSPFNPSTGTTNTQVRKETFAMWVRANMHNINKPFRKDTWRTCRPWLSLQDCEREYRKFKQISLGYMQIGNKRISNKGVQTAVKYERKAQGIVNVEDIMRIIDQLFDYSEETIPLDTVRRIVHEHRGPQLMRNRIGKDVRNVIGDNPKLKPKIHWRKLANIILKVFEPDDKHNPNICYQLQPVLIAMKQDIHEQSVAFKKAIAFTGTKLKHKHTMDIIQHTIKKYYKVNYHTKEPLDRLKFILKMHNVDEDDPNWQLVDTRISPRHIWTPRGYDVALDKAYADTPIIQPLQKPFYEYHTQHRLWRIKQDIPWDNVLKGHTRGITDTHTIQIINQRIKQLGFTPYHHLHPIFEPIRVRGIQISTNSSSSPDTRDNSPSHNV